MSDDGWGGIGDQYSDRDTSETEETTETNDTMETTATNETRETSETNAANETSSNNDTNELNIREDWNGRTIYLPDDDVEKLDLRYEELNLEWRREHGEGLAKNERFYPAVIRAALNETTIEEELDLE